MEKRVDQTPRDFTHRGRGARESWERADKPDRCGEACLPPIRTLYPTPKTLPSHLPESFQRTSSSGGLSTSLRRDLAICTTDKPLPPRQADLENARAPDRETGRRPKIRRSISWTSRPNGAVAPALAVSYPMPPVKHPASRKPPTDTANRNFKQRLVRLPGRHDKRRRIGCPQAIEPRSPSHDGVRGFFC